MLASSPMLATPPLQTPQLHVFGPRPGYTPIMSHLVSMMDWMRDTIILSVRKLNVEQLDYLLDDQANTIGAMLYHLAATERFYQLHTLEGRDWGDWPTADAEEFSTASGLGDKARAEIKGNPIEFYLDKLASVREQSLQMLKDRDDEWLMAVDEDWYWGPTNNYCKWFHLVEHESNHNGQVKLIRGRMPK